MAGFKKQDLCALGSVLMAWLMGIKHHQKLIRKKTEIQEAVDAFTRNTKYNQNIRHIIQKTIGTKEKPIPISDIHKYNIFFLEETSPGERLPK